MQPGIAPAAGSRGRYGAERQRILGFVEEFAREFNDEAPLSSSVSRAYNLWQRSGIPIEAFSSFMYEARSLTQEHSASVQKTSQKEGSGPWAPPKNKMAYYFAILEQLVEQHTPEDSTPEGTANASRGNGKARVVSEKTAGESDTKRGAIEKTTPDPPGSSRTRVSRGNGSSCTARARRHMLCAFMWSMWPRNLGSS